MPARREIEVEATPEDVFDALASEEGRERWLDEPGPRDPVEMADAPAPAGVVVVGGRRARHARRVPGRRGARGRARGGDRDAPDGAAGAPGGGASPRSARERRRSGAVFAALADPTRRAMVESLLRDGTTTRARR